MPQPEGRCVEGGVVQRPSSRHEASAGDYSTVTDLARLRGWSTSVPISTAV